MTQLITNFFRKKFNINNYLIHIMLFVSLLLFALQLSAETNYLYASDIIDRDNRSIYNSNPVRHYSRQGEPSYPNDIRKNIQSGPQQQYYFAEKNHYNTVPIQLQNTDATEVYRYPVKQNNNNYTDHFSYDQTMRGKALMLPDRSNEQYHPTSSGLMYVSDLEPKRSIRQKNNAMRRVKRNQCCPQAADSIRYISAPTHNTSIYNKQIYNEPMYNEATYNKPKALPARMPGYNLFSSDYNRNVLNNVYDVPNNPFSGVGIFPTQRTLFRNNR